MNRIYVVVPFVFALSGCTEVSPDPGVGGTPGQACTATVDTELTCDDGIDSDCDGATDCADSDCADDIVCQSPGGNQGDCGEATYPGETLAIPDGVGMSYETSLTISGFTNGQKLQSADGFVSVCVDMEHSWLRDLQLELECPSGQILVLQEFLGQTGGPIYMGVPDDNDGYDPIPGIGMNYCWSAAATNPTMLDWGDANQNFLDPTLPEGDYQTSGQASSLVGCDLNGAWTIRATDDWAIDNGYIFGWTVNFNPDIIEDCSGWVD